MSVLRWTAKSSATRAEDLVRQSFEVSSRTVLRLLHRLGYSLQANAKVTEGRQHPDRDAQFRYLNDTAAGFIAAGQPAISVDTKKKELIGDYANGGTEWSPAGEPERVQVHDFADRALGEFAKAIPYGNLRRGQRRGLGARGRRGRHRRARRGVHPALVGPDGPGPLSRRRAPVDHLTTLRTIVELISAATTMSGLTVQAAYDPNWYPTGVKVRCEPIRHRSVRPAGQGFRSGSWRRSFVRSCASSSTPSPSSEPASPSAAGAPPMTPRSPDRGAGPSPATPCTTSSPCAPPSLPPTARRRRPRKGPYAFKWGEAAGWRHDPVARARALAAEPAPDQQEQAAREGRGRLAVARSLLPTCASPHSNAESQER